MKQPLPKGWTEGQVRAIAEHYDSQTEDEALAEYEVALKDPNYAWIQVPRELAHKVILMIQDYEDSIAAKAAKPAKKPSRKRSPSS
jgi:hypothetical protein